MKKLVIERSGRDTLPNPPEENTINASGGVLAQDIGFKRDITDEVQQQAPGGRGAQSINDELRKKNLKIQNKIVI